MFELNVNGKIVTNAEIFIKENNSLQMNEDYYFTYTLIIKSKQIFLKMEFENGEVITQFNPDDNNGVLDSNPSNGITSVSWNNNKLSFSVGKFGDGNGGNLTTSIMCDDIEMNEFKKILTMWKTIYNAFDKI